VVRIGVFVTKADGSKQLFDREKVVRTCLRMGASRQLAFEVAEGVEKSIYEGVPTARILDLIFMFMRKDKPGVGHLFDLRKGLSLMVPQPEFEVFVQVLLSYQGYEVTPNQILRGRCAEHEVDAIAKKNGVIYFVEAKHHSNYHALTGLDETRIARAVLEDVSESYFAGNAEPRIDKAMIITNTRYSEHATRYGLCRDIVQIGWNYPPDHGLEHMIVEKGLHPLSCVKGINNSERLRFASCGIVFVRQLLAEDLSELTKKTGLSKNIISKIMERTQLVDNTLEYSQ
jgi:Holliday junction resolvase-like predicted endonuclease